MEPSSAALRHVTVSGQTIIDWTTKKLDTSLEKNKEFLVETLSATRNSLRQEMKNFLSETTQELVNTVGPVLQQSLVQSQTAHDGLARRLDEMSSRLEETDRKLQETDRKLEETGRKLNEVDGGVVHIGNYLSERDAGLAARLDSMDRLLQTLKESITQNIQVPPARSAMDRDAQFFQNGAVPDLDFMNSTVDSSVNLDSRIFSGEGLGIQEPFLQSPPAEDRPYDATSDGHSFQNISERGQLQVDEDFRGSTSIFVDPSFVCPDASNIPPRPRKGKHADGQGPPKVKVKKYVQEGAIPPRKSTGRPQKKQQAASLPTPTPSDILDKQEEIAYTASLKRKSSSTAGSSKRVRISEAPLPLPADPDFWPAVLPAPMEDAEEMIMCESCYKYYHEGCVGLTPESVAAMGETEWFCPICKNNDAVRRTSDRSESLRPGKCPRPGCDRPPDNFVVGKLIGRRKARLPSSTAKHDYLVMWDGYPADRADWQPEDVPALQTQTSQQLREHFKTTADDEGLDLEDEADVILLAEASENGWDPGNGELIAWKRGKPAGGVQGA